MLAATDAEPAVQPATSSEIPSLERVAAAFPKLEILELIGYGGMGFVFKARQPHLGRLVALKLLSDHLAKEPRFAERFNREGRVLARMNHPNIVTVYDFGATEHFYFLLMEYVDGVNLRQAMEAGRFSPGEALRVVPKICEALQYAHEQGILHRDIKPANILLDTRGQVKIADFGIAKLVGEEKADVTLTATGATLGTPQYMAPEQLESPSDVDHRADIYSLGVVFYEMLTGELPIGRFPAPSSKTPVGSKVDEVVFRTLEKDRERRYQSAGEMKTQVEHLDPAEKTGARTDREHPDRPSHWSNYMPLVLRRSGPLKWVFISVLIAAIGLAVSWIRARRIEASNSVHESVGASPTDRRGEVLAYQWLNSADGTNTANSIRFTFTNVELRQEDGHERMAMDYATDIHGDCEEVFRVDGSDVVTRKHGLQITPEGSPPVVRQRFEWRIPGKINRAVVADLTKEFAKALVGKSFVVPEGDQRPLLRFPMGISGDVNVGIGARLRDGSVNR
jgi:serine/threonine protein kinase